MANNREPKNIESKVLLSVSRSEFQDGQKATEVRVVDWIVNNKHYPQLEKREMFMGDNGEWKMGKAKGFSRKDMELVQDRWGEIMDALGARLPENQQRPGGEATPAATVAAPPLSGPVQEQDF